MGDSMFKLIKNGELYCPEYQGEKNILICLDKFLYIETKDKRMCENFDKTMQVIDAGGMIVVPGFIDQHMHFLGGGGKLGYKSRAGIVQFNDIVRFGVTTAISSLGVDSYLKKLDDLLVRARELDCQGLTTYILTGSFQLPLKSLTDNVLTDLFYIEKVIGIGEIGIADPFDSNPSKEEIIRIAANARALGAFSEKPGKIFIHIGPSIQKLKLMFEVINKSNVPIEQFIITHVNRSEELLEEAIQFAQLGGIIDITTGISPEFGIIDSVAPEDALKHILDRGIPIENITLSSDAGGFRTVVGNNNEMHNVLLSSETLISTIKRAQKKHNICLSQSLKTITSNISRVWNLKNKGEISPFFDADLVFLDSIDLNIKKVMSKGNIVFEQ